MKKVNEFIIIDKCLLKCKLKNQKDGANDCLIDNCKNAYEYTTYVYIRISDTR